MFKNLKNITIEHHFLSVHDHEQIKNDVQLLSVLKTVLIHVISCVYHDAFQIVREPVILQM
jgi:hypothetical protein